MHAEGDAADDCLPTGEPMNQKSPAHQQGEDEQGAAPRLCGVPGGPGSSTSRGHLLSVLQGERTFLVYHDESGEVPRCLFSQIQDPEYFDVKP